MSYNFIHQVDLKIRARSFPYQPKQSHSLSLLHAASTPGRRLVAVKSEGSTLVRTNLDRKLTGNIPAPPLENKSINPSPGVDDSSDESGAEDEHIIRIDSPSRLSFHHAA